MNLRRPVSRIPRRRFGTTPSSRQVETTVSAGRAVDDGFVPFEDEGVKQRGVRGKGMREKVDAEWHAEIEIKGAWPKRTRGGEGEAVVVDGGPEVPGELKASREEARTEYGRQSAVDGVALHNLHPPPVAGAEPSLAMPPPVATSTTSARLGDIGPAEGRSRAENRLARRQRRMIEGAWGPQRLAREKAFSGEELEQVSADEHEEDDQVSAVLQQIERMDGPAVGQEKTRMEKKSKRAARRSGEQATEGPAVLHANRRAEKKAKRAATRALERSGEQATDTEQGNAVKRDGAAAKTQADAAGAVTRRERLRKSKDDVPNVSNVKSTAKGAPKRHPDWENWRVQKEALAVKFGDAGWDPSKKLSPDTMNGIRALRASDPAAYTTAKLAEHFEITPEAIRRILRSKWRPSEDEIERRRVAWEQRGIKKWEDMASKGIRPPKKWRELGVGWELKSGSSTPKSAGVGVGRVRDKRRVEMEQGVGMLGGIEEGIEGRIE